VGWEARKLPADGSVFFLNFPIYITYQVRKTLGGKSSRAEIKGVNVSSALPDVERFS